MKMAPQLSSRGPTNCLRLKIESKKMRKNEVRENRKLKLVVKKKGKEDDDHCANAKMRPGLKLGMRSVLEK